MTNMTSMFSGCEKLATAVLPDSIVTLGSDAFWNCGRLTAIHYLLIRTAKGTRSLVGDFRYYAQILAKNKSLSALSEETGEDPEDVKKKLRTMCKRGYFKGHIDLQQDRMVLESSKGEYAARCPGCGATTRIRKTGGTCRYCGNPLQ